MIDRKIGRKKKRRGSYLPLTLLIIALLLIPFFIWSYYLEAISRPNYDGPGPVEIVVGSGESVSSISEKLYESGLINSETLFKIYARLSGSAGSLQAGRFDIPTDLSVVELVELLSTGGSFTSKFTFLEGWRREEMAEYLGEQKTANSKQLVNEFLSESRGLEGYLFPDTYIVEAEVTGSQIVDMMRQNFEDRFSELSFSGLTRSQVVIFASIVEREARFDKDRPIIAGILIKRWQNDWPLEADATVQFPLGKPGEWWPKTITQEDLEVASPYNTRKFAGLPPAPICNPGFASLEAVANYQNTPYWYYLSDQSGKMHYSETLEEHNANVFRYLR